MRKHTLTRVLSLALTLVMLLGVAPIIPMANAANVTPSSPNDTEMNSHYILFSDIDATKTTKNTTLATATGIWASHDSQAAVHVDQTTTIDGTPLNAAAFSLNKSMKNGWGPYNWGTSAAKMEYIKNAGKGTTVAALKAAGMKYLVFDLWVDEQVAAYTSSAWCILRDQYADEWNNGNEAISKTDLDNLLKEKGLYVDGNSYQSYVSTNSWNGKTTTVEFQTYLGDGRDGADRVMLDANFKGLKAGWNRIELSLDALYNNTKSITDVTHFMIYENQLVRLLVPDANPNMVQNAGAADGLNSTGPDKTAYCKLETKLANIRFWDGVDETANSTLPSIADLDGVIPLFTGAGSWANQWGGNGGGNVFSIQQDVVSWTVKMDATANAGTSDSSDWKFYFRNANRSNSVDASGARYFMFDIWCDTEETATNLGAMLLKFKFRSQYNDGVETWDDRQAVIWNYSLNTLNVLDTNLHQGWNRVVIDVKARPFSMDEQNLSLTSGGYLNSFHYNPMKKAMEINGTTALSATSGVTGVALTTLGANDDKAYANMTAFETVDGTSVTEFTAGVPVFVQNPIDKNEYFYYYMSGSTPMQIRYTRDANGTFRRTKAAENAKRLKYDESEFQYLEVYAPTDANGFAANATYQLKLDNVCFLKTDAALVLMPERELTEYVTDSVAGNFNFTFGAIDGCWNGTRDVVWCPTCSVTANGGNDRYRFDASKHTTCFKLNATTGLYEYIADAATRNNGAGRIDWSGDGAALKLPIKVPAVDLTYGGTTTWTTGYLEMDLYIPNRKTIDTSNTAYKYIVGIDKLPMQLELTSSGLADQAEIRNTYTVADYMYDANGNSTANWTDAQFVPGWYHIKLPLSKLNGHSYATGVYQTDTYAVLNGNNWQFNPAATRAIRFSNTSNNFVAPAVSGESYKFKNVRFTKGSNFDTMDDGLLNTLSATEIYKSVEFVYADGTTKTYTGEDAFTSANVTASVKLTNDHGETTTVTPDAFEFLTWATNEDVLVNGNPVTPEKYQAIMSASHTFKSANVQYTFTDKGTATGYNVDLGDLTVTTQKADLSFIGDALVGASVAITNEAGASVTPAQLSEWYAGAAVTYTVNGEAADALPTEAGTYDVSVSVFGYKNGTVTFAGAGADMTGIEILGTLDMKAGYTLALDGTIDLKLVIADISETVRGAVDSYNLCVYSDSELIATYKLADVLESDGIVSVPVQPNQMTNKYEFVICDAENEGTKVGLSVQSYAEATLASEDASAALKTLMTNLLNYGAAAQTYFDKVVDGLANANAAYETEALAIYNADAKVFCTDYVSKVTNIANQYDGAFVKPTNWPLSISATISFDSTNSMIVRFLSNVDLGNVTATLGSAAMDVDKHVQGDKVLYAVMIKDIQAADLDTAYTITLNGDNGIYTVRCNPMIYVLATMVEYANTAEPTEDQTNFANLLKALYLYNQAANAYYGN